MKIPQPDSSSFSDAAAKAEEYRRRSLEASEGGNVSSSTYWEREAERMERLPSYRAQLLSREAKFFQSVAREILVVVPDAEEIWLHGSRALAQHKRTSDWDFVVMVPALDGPRRLAIHKAMDKTPSLRRLLNRAIDIQAETFGSDDKFCRVVRDEGMVVWRREE
jgi:hypothetical protein